MKTDLAAFVDLIEVDSDETEVTHDPLQKFFEDAELAGTISGGKSAHQHVTNFRVEAAQRDVPIKAAYRKIAEAAAPKVKAPAETNALKKNFSQPDARLAYRKYFEEQAAAGKTASATLNEWLEAFPNANPSVEKLMREVCAEFA